MIRFALMAAIVAVAACSGCSKSAGTKESKGEASKPAEVIAVPGGATAPEAKAPGGTANDPAFKLQPDEGTLSIELPADAVAGAETTAKVVVTTSPKYKINFPYRTKLTLDSGEGVTLAKAEFKAGGPDESKGDAEKFEEKELAFTVKLTPKASGSHTVNGMFKFAVCDKDQCLAKHEAIAIQVVAK